LAACGKTGSQSTAAATQNKRSAFFVLLLSSWFSFLVRLIKQSSSTCTNNLAFFYICGVVCSKQARKRASGSAEPASRIRTASIHLHHIAAATNVYVVQQKLSFDAPGRAEHPQQQAQQHHHNKPRRAVCVCVCFELPIREAAALFAAAREQIYSIAWR
jgi:hypothetical protein